MTIEEELAEALTLARTWMLAEGCSQGPGTLYERIDVALVRYRSKPKASDGFEGASISSATLRRVTGVDDAHFEERRKP